MGPFLFTLTFAYFIGAQAPLKLPGAPFLLASALLVLAMRDRGAHAVAPRGSVLPRRVMADARPHAGALKAISVRVW